MDPSHPNYPQHVPAHVQRRRSRVAGESRVGDVVGAQIHQPRTHVSGAGVVDGSIPHNMLYHPYPTYAVPPHLHPQGRVHQFPPPASSSYYPVHGRMMDPPDVHIPPPSPTSSAASASVSGAPNSPGRVMIFNSGENYPQWSAHVQPNTMVSVSAVRDERDDYQRLIEPVAAAAPTTSSGIGAMRQQRHHSVGHTPYPLPPPQHQQPHRRGYSLQQPPPSSFYPTTTAPVYATEDMHFQQQQPPQNQTYIQSYPSHPSSVQQQWTPPNMPYQADSLARQQRRDSLGYLTHSTSSSAFPSPTQAVPSPSATHVLAGREATGLARENVRLRERRDSIAPPPTASSSSSIASSMAHPHHPGHFDHSSSAIFHDIEAPSLGDIPSSTMPGNANEPTSVSGELDADNNATATVPTSGRREKRKDDRPHKCPICAKGFPRPSALETHMTVHSGAKPYPCPVKACNKSFAVRSNARRHLKTHGIKLKTRERRTSSTTAPTTSTGASSSKGKKRTGPSLDKARAFAGRQVDEEEDEYERDTSPNNDDGLESEDEQEERDASPLLEASTTAAGYPPLAPSVDIGSRSTYISLTGMQLPTSSTATSSTAATTTGARTTTRNRASRPAAHRGHVNVHADYDPLGLGGAVETVPIQEFDVLQPPPLPHPTRASGSGQQTDPSPDVDNHDASLHDEVASGGEMTTKKKSAGRRVTVQRRTSKRKEKGQDTETTTAPATAGSHSGSAGGARSSGVGAPTSGGRALRAQRQANASARRTRGTGGSSTQDAPASRRDAGIRPVAGTETVHPSSLEAIEVINNAQSSSSLDGEDRPYELEFDVETGGPEGVLNDLSESALRNLYPSRREPNPEFVARAVPSSGEVILPAMDQTALDKLIAAPTDWKKFERQKSMRQRLSEEMEKGVATGGPSATSATSIPFGGVLDRMLEFAHADQAEVRSLQSGTHLHTYAPTGPLTASSWPVSPPVASNTITESVTSSTSTAMDLTPPALAGTSSSIPDTTNSISPPEHLRGCTRADGTWLPHSMTLFKNLDALKNSSPFDLIDLSTISLDVPLPVSRCVLRRICLSPPC